MGLMPNRPQPKWRTMEEISRLLNIPIYKPTRGSSIPHLFFSDIATQMGIPQQSSMPALARTIIENSNLTWSSSFSSEHTLSGGGSTVTALGLLQLKNAVLVWLGRNPEDLSVIQEETDYIEWQPDSNWEQIREELPREVRLGISRPQADKFRAEVLEAYQFSCAISRVKSRSVLDVAHIVPYHGVESDRIQNSILLRSDLHRLFDCGLLLISFDEGSELFISQIHSSVMEDYGEFDYVALSMPEKAEFFPSKKAIEIKKEICSELWSN
jgi:HNH endonuclease